MEDLRRWRITNTGKRLPALRHRILTRDTASSMGTLLRAGQRHHISSPYILLRRTAHRRPARQPPRGLVYSLEGDMLLTTLDVHHPRHLSQQERPPRQENRSRHPGQNISPFLRRQTKRNKFRCQMYLSPLRRLALKLTHAPADLATKFKETAVNHSPKPRTCHVYATSVVVSPAFSFRLVRQR